MAQRWGALRFHPHCFTPFSLRVPSAARPLGQKRVGDMTLQVVTAILPMRRRTQHDCIMSHVVFLSCKNKHVMLMCRECCCIAWSHCCLERMILIPDMFEIWYIYIGNFQLVHLWVWCFCDVNPFLLYEHQREYVVAFLFQLSSFEGDMDWYGTSIKPMKKPT